LGGASAAIEATSKHMESHHLCSLEKEEIAKKKRTYPSRMKWVSDQAPPGEKKGRKTVLKKQVYWGDGQEGGKERLATICGNYAARNKFSGPNLGGKACSW